MIVRSIGNSLMVILPELLGKKITAWFDLVRPLIAFKFQTVCALTFLVYNSMLIKLIVRYWIALTTYSNWLPWIRSQNVWMIKMMICCYTMMAASQRSHSDWKVTSESRISFYLN